MLITVVVGVYYELDDRLLSLVVLLVCLRRCGCLLWLVGWCWVSCVLLRVVWLCW